MASLTSRKLLVLAIASGLFCAFHGRCFARDAQASERQQYEARIAALESRISRLERMVAKLSETGNANSAGAMASAPAPNPVSANPPIPPPQPVAFVARPKFETPPELVPEVGKIGAEVGLLLAGSANPWGLNKGQFAGGFIDLPLFDRPAWLHGKVSYEISVGLSQSNTTFNTTSNVAQVANLSVLNAVYPAGGVQNVIQAVSGTGAAPFPVTTSTVTKLRLLQVVPFALKYTPTVLDRWRLRPYVVAGFGTYVTIHEQYPAQGASTGVREDASLPPAVLAAVSQLYGGQAPFGGPLIAGQLTQSPELEARGLPSGHGNIDFGVHLGGGLAYRLSRGWSLGIDARYNKIAGADAGFVTYGTRLSFHF
jgi:opacity protein-like surface antigen